MSDIHDEALQAIAQWENHDQYRVTAGAGLWGKPQAVRFAEEMLRLQRRNEELIASEEAMAGKMRIAEAHAKMVCGLNERLRNPNLPPEVRESLDNMATACCSQDYQVVAEYARKVWGLKK